MNNYYVLEPEEGFLFGRKWAYADQVDPVTFGPAERCPVCGNPVSGRRWLEPFRIKLSSAKPEKWGDFLWGAGFPLIVSAKFRRIYEEEGLTGIDEFSQPVEIVRIGTRKASDFTLSPPIYHLIHVTWGRGNQDDIASGVKHEHPEKVVCQYCRIGVSGKEQEKIVIDERSWDGSDIFKPRGAPAQFLVSEHFKNVAEMNRLNNLWLIPVEKYGFDEHRIGLGMRFWYINS